MKKYDLVQPKYPLCAYELTNNIVGIIMKIENSIHKDLLDKERKILTIYWSHGEVVKEPSDYVTFL